MPVSQQYQDALAKARQHIGVSDLVWLAGIVLRPGMAGGENEVERDRKRYLRQQSQPARTDVPQREGNS